MGQGAMTNELGLRWPGPGMTMLTDECERVFRVAPEVPTLSRHELFPDHRIVWYWRTTGRHQDNEPPAWAHTVSERLSRLVALRPNWKGNDSAPVHPDALEAGLRVLFSVMAEDTLPPS